MSLIDNIDKIEFATLWDIDKIIGVASGSFTATAPSPGPPQLSTATHTTNFGETYYFQGIYSIDDGDSWNDFNSMVPDLTTPTFPVLQTINVFGLVGASGTFNVVAVNYYDSVHSTGTEKTVLWKVIFFSKNNQGAITPEVIPDATHFTSIDRNYQKIALQGEIEFDLTSGAARTETITHDLGYIPLVRAFYQQTSPNGYMESLYGTYSIETRITETQVSFVLDAALSTATRTGNIEYRIYYDR